MLKLEKDEPNLYKKQGNKLKDDIRKTCISLFREYDLGAILDRLENLIVLPTAYRVGITSEEMYNNNVKVANHSIHIAKRNFKKLESEYEKRIETFRAIRTKYPDFAKNIEPTLPEKQWDKYDVARGNYKRNFDNLYDFLYSFESYSKIIHLNYEDVWVAAKDIVAEMVDTPELNKLAFMQDKYILYEFYKIDRTQFDEHIQNNIKEIEDTINERIAKYKLYRIPKGHKPYVDGKETNGDER